MKNTRFEEFAVYQASKDKTIYYHRIDKAFILKLLIVLLQLNFSQEIVICLRLYMQQ